VRDEQAAPRRHALDVEALGAEVVAIQEHAGEHAAAQELGREAVGVEAILVDAVRNLRDALLDLEREVAGGEGQQAPDQVAERGAAGGRSHRNTPAGPPPGSRLAISAGSGRSPPGRRVAGSAWPRRSERPRA